MNRKQKMYAQIKKHGLDLNVIFETELAPVALCKKLRRLEIKAHWLAAKYCNGNIDMDAWDTETEKIIKKIYKILGKEKCIETGLFVNGDARGYALKLREKWTSAYRNNGGAFYTDWGGYGIVAPEFDGA